MGLRVGASSVLSVSLRQSYTLEGVKEAVGRRQLRRHKGALKAPGRTALGLLSALPDGHACVRNCSELTLVSCALWWTKGQKLTELSKWTLIFLFEQLDLERSRWKEGHSCLVPLSDTTQTLTPFLLWFL